MSPFVPPVVAFLAGSIPFGLLVARMKGVDIRRHGSGNIGATNVLRAVGKPYGIAVFVLDFLKGLLPVLWAGSALAQHPHADLVGLGTALAAILGHNYSPWIGFKGGKGIATSAGGLVALFPLAVGAAVVFWFVLFKTTRYVSVASMGAAAAIPAALGCQRLAGFHPPTGAQIAFGLVIATLAIWRHRSNLRNLAAGKEHRFGEKKEPGRPADPPAASPGPS